MGNAITGQDAVDLMKAGAVDSPVTEAQLSGMAEAFRNAGADGTLSGKDLILIKAEEAAAAIKAGELQAPDPSTIEAVKPLLQQLGIENPNETLIANAAAAAEMTALQTQKSAESAPGGAEPGTPTGGYTDDPNSDAARALRARLAKQNQAPQDQRQPTGQNLNDLFWAMNKMTPNDRFKPFLDGFDVLNDATDEGGILVRSKISNCEIHLRGGGVEGNVTTEQMLDPSGKGLEAQIEMALMAKAMPNGEQGMAFYGSDELSQLVGEKAASLAGLKILNPSEKTLEQLNPDLAKKMDEVWARMQADQQRGVAQAAPTEEEFKAAADFRTQTLAAKAAPDNGAGPVTAATVIEQVFNNPENKNIDPRLLQGAADKLGVEVEKLSPRVMKERMEECARMGEGEIGKGTNPETNVPLIEKESLPADAVDAAKAALKQHGIDDPDGELANGLAAYSLRVAQSVNEKIESAPAVAPTGNLPVEAFTAIMTNPRASELYNESLAMTGMKPEQTDPDLDPAARLENIARHGLSFIGEGTHETTGKPLVSETDIQPHMIEAAKALFEEYGIKDPDGTLAQGFAALNQTIFNDPQLDPALRQLTGTTPDGAAVQIPAPPPAVEQRPATAGPG